MIQIQLFKKWKMTKDKVKEIIENYFEGSWEDNKFTIIQDKDTTISTDFVSVIGLLLEFKYIISQNKVITLNIDENNNIKYTEEVKIPIIHLQRKVTLN
jgi:hypothetical protein